MIFIRKISIAFLLLFVIGKAQATDMTSFLAGTDAFMKKYVSNGEVDYAAIKANKAMLSKLETMIADMSLRSASTDIKKAFYINAYNLLAIKSVVAAYPAAKKPMDIRGFFDVKKHKVAGYYTTLDNLEKVKLKDLDNDPRTHFAVVCAAQGCPKLASYAFRGDKLDAQLDERTKLNMRSDYFIRVKDSENKVYVSEIFKWYAKDFGSSKEKVMAFINKYRDSKIPADYAMDYYTYDWSINKKK